MASVIPQAAIDIFSRNTNNTPLDVVKRGVCGHTGKPISLRTAERWYQLWKLGSLATDEENSYEEEVSVDEQDETLIAKSVSSRIKTLDQLLSEAQVDQGLWKVDDWKIKTYEGMRRKEHKDLRYTEGRADGYIKDQGELAVVTMWSVWAKLIRREEKPLEDAVDKIIERMRSASPRSRYKKFKPVGDHLFVPCIVDAHIGKRSLSGNYSIQQAAEDFIEVGHALIDRVLSARVKISHIVFPTLGDALHMDNRANTTTLGTWLEVSGDYRDAVDAICYAHTEVITALASLAPVRVIVGEGNHDRNSSYWLGKLLEAYFSKWSTVSIDMSRDPRKYVAYGKNLLGFTHGDGPKAQDLPLLMAQESPEWSTTSFRTFFRGNWHKKEGMYHPIVSEKGVVIETLPALCPTDVWHQMKGYIGNHRSAEARLFHYEYGPAGIWPVFLEDMV